MSKKAYYRLDCDLVSDIHRTLLDALDNYRARNLGVNQLLHCISELRNLSPSDFVRDEQVKCNNQTCNWTGLANDAKFSFDYLSGKLFIECPKCNNYVIKIRKENENH